VPEKLATLSRREAVSKCPILFQTLGFISRVTIETAPLREADLHEFKMAVRDGRFHRLPPKMGRPSHHQAQHFAPLIPRDWHDGKPRATTGEH